MVCAACRIWRVNILCNLLPKMKITELVYGIMKSQNARNKKKSKKLIKALLIVSLTWFLTVNLVLVPCILIRVECGISFWNGMTHICYFNHTVAILLVSQQLLYYYGLNRKLQRNDTCLLRKVGIPHLNCCGVCSFIERAF